MGNLAILLSLTEAQRHNQTPQEQGNSLPNALFITSVHIPEPVSWAAIVTEPEQSTAPV